MKLSIIANVLRCQAVADALGHPLEFTRNPTPRDLDVVARRMRHHISDDTQMTLFGMEACTDWLINRPLDFEKVYLKHMAEWRRTQSPKSRTKNGTWLGKQKVMHKAVAPGGTCMSALDDVILGLDPVNTSNGCGSVMKAAPFPLLFLSNELDQNFIVRQAMAVSTKTHGSRQTAANIRDYISVATGLMTGIMPEIMKRYGEEGTKITDHGQGWNATECLDMAMWAVYNAADYDELLELAICHSGDSDSVAAVAGALWGFAGLPMTFNKWKIYMQLDEMDVIEKVITNFALQV